MQWVWGNTHARLNQFKQISKELCVFIGKLSCYPFKLRWQTVGGGVQVLMPLISYFVIKGTNMFVALTSYARRGASNLRPLLSRGRTLTLSRRDTRATLLTPPSWSPSTGLHPRTISIRQENIRKPSSLRGPCKTDEGLLQNSGIGAT